MENTIKFPNTATPLAAEAEADKRKTAISKLQGYRGTVPFKNTIRNLPSVKEGEIFWVEDDNKPYVVSEKDKQKVILKALDETATISTGITIFDMNKGIVAKEPLFNWDDIEAIETLQTSCREWAEKESDHTFFLLYGRDIHYITLFKKTSSQMEDLLTNIKSVLEPVGDIVSMDFNTSANQEASIEIWIRTPNSQAELLYLFPYDQGVINI